MALKETRRHDRASYLVTLVSPDITPMAQTSVPNQQTLGHTYANTSHKSMVDILLDPLDQLQRLSHTLYLSLAPAQSKPPHPPPIAAFLEVDASLAAALQLAREHQINQRRIEELKTEVLSLDARLREVWFELEHGKRELEDIIEEGNVRLAAVTKAKEGQYLLFL